MKQELIYEIKKLFGKKKLIFWVNDSEFEKLNDQDKSFEEDVLRKMENYKISCDSVVQIKRINIRNRENDHVNLSVYVLRDGSEKINVAEMMEIEVNPKIRSKGVGSWLNKQAEKLATENKCEYMLGELQDDGDLTKRKMFFQKNGYQIWESPNAGFSGWVIKKSLNE